MVTDVEAKIREIAQEKWWNEVAQMGRCRQSAEISEALKELGVKGEEYCLGSNYLTSWYRGEKPSCEDRHYWSYRLWCLTLGKNTLSL